MSDYGFVHEGKVYTPNATAGVSASENSERNAKIERAELKQWAEAPSTFAPAYYHFPSEEQGGRPYRDRFIPCLYRYERDVRITTAYVSTWLGTRIGTITSARVYRHNMGHRFVSLRVHGTNGAEYHGRASWDCGQCVTLRRVK